MIAEVYEALKEAGASEEKSKAAAQALADYDNRFDRLDLDLAGIRGELAVLKAELAMVKWIVSGVGFGVLLLVLRSFWPG
ncbi:MAG TPA: integrase [Hyphomicrobiaceae bacterium]|nr:integrase [Hyphomicrobiaceae bacterium]